MSRAARQGAAARGAAPGPAGRRAGSRASAVRVERAGAGELCVASRHPAPPPACFPGPRAPPLAQAQDRFSGPPFSRFEFPPARRERQNTRMVIAGLFAPILLNAHYNLERGKRQNSLLLMPANQQDPRLPLACHCHSRARSQHLRRKSPEITGLLPAGSAGRPRSILQKLLI